ncbi:metallophosphoesterase [Salipiger mucosus]|uniref:Serine/threonine protein phosphatase n=1 Tax=Salipiger mucosus DSM 16094 TaxID=1123237 RepID=S9Q9V5_9RHOB|nr:metallophosphoesterase [Salipiger mucosus]EPX76792.1 serine/threonine protein phosphatase [Salipiger mucosus DSM 16094]
MLRLETSGWKPLPGTSGPNHVFAIGDVHGRDDLLKAALEVIAGIEKAGATKKAIFLGDLIDRGPGGLKALSVARCAWDYAKVEDRVLLFGNHEIMLWEALNESQPPRKGQPTQKGDRARRFEIWRQCGGQAVIDEIEALGYPASTGPDLVSSLRKVSTGDPFRDFRSHHVEGDLFFVHAGIDPLVDREHFLKSPKARYAWVRLPFLIH